MAWPDKHTWNLAPWIGVQKEEDGQSSALPLTRPAPNLSHVGAGEEETFSPEQRHTKDTCLVSSSRARMWVAVQS